MAAVGLDDIDRELMLLLQADDRLAVAEMGKRLGVPPSTLNDRIRRLVRNGTITGFHARVAPERLGLGLLAFVLVEATGEADAALMAHVSAAPEVTECHRIAGRWTHLLKVRVSNSGTLAAFLDAIGRRVPGARAESLVVLSSLKEATVLAPPEVD